MLLVLFYPFPSALFFKCQLWYNFSQDNLLSFSMLTRFFYLIELVRKLHLTHNDYVLLLCEASEFERDMRTILLPGLLEHQQAIQEDMIEKWKIVLQEVQMYSNTTDRKWLETQVRRRKNS